MLKREFHKALVFYLQLLVIVPSVSIYVQAQDPNTVEICEGEPVTVMPEEISQTGGSPLYSWYHDSNGTMEIFSGTEDGVEYQLGDDGSLTIIGLTYESTADTYIQASTYNYYVGIAEPNESPPLLDQVKVRVFNVPDLQTTRASPVCDPKGFVDLSTYIDGFDPTVFDYEIISPSGNAISIDGINKQSENGSYSVRSSYKDFGCWSDIKTIEVTIAETDLEPNFNYHVDMGQGNAQTNGIAQAFQPIDFVDATSWNTTFWHWSFGDGNESNLQNPTYSYTDKGNYSVIFTALDDLGCAHSFERVIEVRDEYMIIMPNAFSPSSSKNFYFKPEHKGIASMKFFVFDLWGELIFSTDKLESRGWNGTWNGKDAPNGNYIYKGIFLSSSGEEIIKDGVFILIR
ncbi:PKD domain-containing protein [Algoriphagus resistens]|uniref:PKD domain-containing protein n=1 Tax=Algoriphagus resistens TaxID=1750590 RepID=UPI00071685DC|nr:PKD domain-containing protein [Algoriphagus resistens]